MMPTSMAVVSSLFISDNVVTRVSLFQFINLSFYLVYRLPHYSQTFDTRDMVSLPVVATTLIHFFHTYTPKPDSTRRLLI
jgi:hypothetical protein